MSQRWKDNAHEFRALYKQGFGVRLAFLAACSVGSAVTVSQFAREAEVQPSVITQCLRKWDRLVAAGWDLDRSQLTPEMADLDMLPEGFVDEYEKLTEGRRAHRHLSKQRLAQTILDDPDYAAAAEEALLELHRAQHQLPRGHRDQPPPVGKPDYWLLSDAHAALFEFVKSAPSQALLGYDIVAGFRREMREMLEELDRAEAGNVLLNADDALSRWMKEEVEP